ncbi:aminoglycoside phosphotransferase family protein [Streptomyces sp. NPDC003952]
MDGVAAGGSGGAAGRGFRGVPAGFARAQVRDNGAAGREFVDGLPGQVAAFLERWELRVTGPGMYGVTALVLPVVRADGTAAALKLPALDEENEREALALRAWAGEGCVRLLADDAPTGTLLLERLDEGRPLSALAVRDSARAVELLGGLLARLTAVPAPAGVRRLGDVAAAMLEAVPGALAQLGEGRERGLVADCAAALAEVAGESGDRLLHWDLHYDNVLAGGREPWLAIDPKPLAGDPGFELFPALVNNFRAEEVLWRFESLAQAVGSDRERARAWTLGRVLQNCLWDVEDGDRPAVAPLGIAEALLGRGGRGRGRCGGS